MVRRRESILSESDDRFRFRQCKKVADAEKNVLDLRWYERGGNRPVVDITRESRQKATHLLRPLYSYSVAMSVAIVLQSVTF